MAEEIRYVYRAGTGNGARGFMCSRVGGPTTDLGCTIMIYQVEPNKTRSDKPLGVLPRIGRGGKAVLGPVEISVERWITVIDDDIQIEIRIFPDRKSVV